MRNLKEIRKLRESSSRDPEDYVREKDSDAEVKDYEPRSKREKEFADIHKTDAKDHPVATDGQFKSKDTKKGKDHKGNNFMNVRKKIKESTEVEEIDEKVEEINEVISAGSLKLKDDSTVTISTADAKKINQVISSLNPENRDKMESEMKKDKKSFAKMLSFVKSQD